MMKVNFWLGASCAALVCGTAGVATAQTAPDPVQTGIPGVGRGDAAAGQVAPQGGTPDPLASNVAGKASNGLEDIIVTARKRAEDVQQVPLSISAVSGAALERRGISNVRELALTVPSLSLVSQSSARAGILQIRGIGSSGNNPGIEPDVGVYFDGAYQKQAATVLQSNLLDLEAVEVLRGPQGTLYGRNTPVGAVIVRSRVPSQTPEAMVQAGLGDYSYRYAMGYIGGGLTKNVAARLSLYGNHLDGYDRNLFDGRRVNGSEQYGGRLRVRWEPSSTVKADLIAFYNHVRSNCCVADNVDPTQPLGIATPAFLAAAQATLGRPYTNLVSKDHVVDSAEAPLERVKNFGLSFTGEVALGSSLTLTSITAYSGTRIDSPRISSSNQPIQPFTTAVTNPVDTYSQELRLSSNEGAFTYQVGAYLFREETSYNEDRVTVSANRVFADGSMIRPGVRDLFAFRQRTNSASGYGQATLRLSDALRLTGGARYSHDDKRGSSASSASPGAPATFLASYPNYNVPDLRYSESKATWLASAQYDLSQTIMLYATASTGWKSGGFNGRIAPANAPLVFGPENANNYEVGVKSTFLERRLLINVSGYKLDVKGFQDSVLNPTTGVGFIVGNAGTVRAKGIEADIQARPIPQLTLNVTGSYLDSHYDNYSAAPCYNGRVPDGSSSNTCNLNGRRPAFSPKWRRSFGGEFTQPVSGEVSAFLRGDIALVGGQYVYATLDPHSYQKGYTLLNLRTGLEGPRQRWRIALWAKNLNNAHYYTAIAPVANGGFISGGGRAGVNSLVGWVGAPRTFGGDVSYRF